MTATRASLLKAWRLLPTADKLHVLDSLRSDVAIFEEHHGDDEEVLEQARRLRVAHDALVAAGMLGQRERFEEHEARFAAHRAKRIGATS